MIGILRDDGRRVLLGKRAVAAGVVLDREVQQLRGRGHGNPPCLASRGEYGQWYSRKLLEQAETRRPTGRGTLARRASEGCPSLAHRANAPSPTAFALLRGAHDGANHLHISRG